MWASSSFFAIIPRMKHLFAATPVVLLIASLVVLGGCQSTRQAADMVEPQPVAPKAPLDPLATHYFEVNDEDSVIGEIQLTRATKEDTLSDIARRFNLGYEELVRANPTVDPWVPGEGREIVLPTQFIIPEGPREGIVVNVAALRLFYFPKRQPGQKQVVITHPIGIGKVGWTTPIGTTKVVSKRKDPTWTPPASVRKEHAERGDILPKVVPAGDDNPLGAYAMNLGWTGYLIHGTNKPYGVGMRSSHGCLRLYPEDIELLFKETAVGTPVRAINQRFVYGWRGNDLYVAGMPPAEEETIAEPASKSAKKPAAKPASKASKKNDGQPEFPSYGPALAEKLTAQAAQRGVQVDVPLMAQLAERGSGIVTPVSRGITAEQYVTEARLVDNRVPEGATWSGSKQLMVSAEEFDAMRSGTILPTTKKETAAPAKPAKKAVN